MSARMLDVKSKFEGIAKQWVNKEWRDSDKVEIDDQTWEPRDRATWPWHEKVEGNVPRERGTIAYPSGISWEIDDVSIELEPVFKPTVVYEQTYENKGDVVLEVTEDWSHTQSIQDSRSIELSQGVSFGTEVTTKAGINIKAVEIGVEQKTTMSMYLGAKESFSKTETVEIKFGRSISFKVPPGKTYKVQYLFEKGEGKVDFEMKIKASGWIYFRTSYKSVPRGGIDPHVYPWKIYGDGPQGIHAPMTDDVRTIKIPGTYKHIRHLKGNFALTDESGANLTKQVQMVTAP